jgi:glyoxylase-like metal-dependent hydrolase (beta-lactamase superfamily II)
VFHPALTDIMARVLANLGTRHAFVVHGHGGLDEIATTGETIVSEVRKGDVHTYRLNPADYGFASPHPAELVGAGTAQGNAEILPGIRATVVPGHNPNMMVVTAESRGETFCFFSDLVPTAAHVTPTWVAAFDLAPIETIDNKFRWLGQAARAGWVCGFGHDPDVPFARIVESEGKFSATRL